MIIFPLFSWNTIILPIIHKQIEDNPMIFKFFDVLLIVDNSLVFRSVLNNFIVLYVKYRLKIRLTFELIRNL